MNEHPSLCILAAHGSSHPSARAALEAFAARVGREFPARRVLLAYTASPRAGNHPAARGAQGQPLEEMLPGLYAQARLGPLRVAVQSLHVIAGEEFGRMCRSLEDLAGCCGAEVAIGGPLLDSPLDAPDVAMALRESLAQDPPAPSEAVVLMGHGTTHAAQSLYRHLAQALRLSLPGARLGVLEAADEHDPLNIRAIASGLAASGVRKALLMPLLTVAGRHAHKDLAGDQPGSWKSVLAAHGIESRADLAGLVEREPFAARLVRRLRALTGGGQGETPWRARA
ncbi:sirohydrochlorin cobaltochelatase [Fundidesulfovibrio agrisoli]|uniref:sirohydrochlorin cobaltochelatase n=1 Tax=Fundidesulfovibrio agrisoli TaxID=2922717 RepID=UPI001FAC8D88|nr:sirohydrochlorin cobaltochelatase [Fundidesulfovibrio agrisoli]